MKNYGMAGLAEQCSSPAYGRFINTDIKFKKTGEKIAETVNALIGKIGNDIEALQTGLAEICKRRDVTVQEVVEADDERKIDSYSTKALNGLGGARQNAIIADLQEDLATMRASAASIREKPGRSVTGSAPETAAS